MGGSKSIARLTERLVNMVFDLCTICAPLSFSYNILIIILTYFLPIVSMTVTYSRVGIELWGSKTIGECTPRQVENVRSKRRVSSGFTGSYGTWLAISTWLWQTPDWDLKHARSGS